MHFSNCNNYSIFIPIKKRTTFHKQSKETTRHKPSEKTLLRPVHSTRGTPAPIEINQDKQPARINPSLELPVEIIKAHFRTKAPARESIPRACPSRSVFNMLKLNFKPRINKSFRASSRLRALEPPGQTRTHTLSRLPFGLLRALIPETARPRHARHNGPFFAKGRREKPN